MNYMILINKNLVKPLWLLLFLISQNGYSFNKLKTYEPRTFEIAGGTNYFETTANFNNVGTKVNLLSSNKYTLIDSFLSSRYVFQDLWSVEAQAFISNAESKNTDFNRSNSTLNALAVSADWMVYRGFMDVIPELTLRYSLDPVAGSQDSVITNEGVMEVTGMIKAQNNYSWFSYYAGGGYSFRSERSGIMPWYLGGGLQWKHSFFGLELNGFQTVTDDGDKGAHESVRNALLQKVDAGSYKFYSVNPSHIQAALNLDIGFSSGFVVKTYLANSISGQSYSNGLTVGLMFNLLFDTVSNKPSRSNEPVVKEVAPIKKEEDYKIQTQDGVDQTLFQKEPDVPVAPVKKEAVKSPSHEDIQDQLDQAEMSIRLKTKKKKKKKSVN